MRVRTIGARVVGAIEYRGPRSSERPPCATNSAMSSSVFESLEKRLHMP